MMKKQILFVGTLMFVLLAFVSGVFAQGLPGELDDLSRIRTGVKSKRLSSADPTGNNGDCHGPIKPGESKSYEIQGAGVIKHIWITIGPGHIKKNDIILRMYWDGKDYPSVEAPVSAFFGNGWGEKYDFSSLPLACGPRDGAGYVSYFSMPFADGVKIEFENQTDIDLNNLYFYIDYVEMDKLPEDMGRFHAWFNHELTEALPEGETEWGLNGAPGCNVDGAGNYLFADIKGKGHFVGINYYVHCPSPMWYGEGDDMIFIDGEEKASILGTGTEDFFNTAWCPASIYYHPYFGYARVNRDIGWMGRTHVYRFFVADPIYFDTSFKGTIEHGHNNNLTLDISTVAYWYQSEPGMLPPAPSKEDRAPKPMVRDQDIHRWRHEWRKNMGNDSQLWGTEKK